MPVIMSREAWSAWLGETVASADELQALLKPYPAERMRAYSVSSRVNSVKHDDAGLIEPMMASGGVRVCQVGGLSLERGRRRAAFSSRSRLLRRYRLHYRH
jgi:SOS response associated peptidase (SRAP)